MRDVFSYLDENRDRFLEELFVLLRQPSISTQGVGVEEMARLLAESMTAIGIEASIQGTGGHPVVLGKLASPDSERTVLIYGHYDVQPPEPLELWQSPPFEPTIRNGRIYGRGTADNKAQLFAHLKAAEAFLQVRGRMPVNVVFLFEGEEEVNSASLKAFAESNRELLKADGALTFDGPGHESGRPIVRCGQKGQLYLEITAKGANRDLHSMRAAMVSSAAWKLVHALASMKDRQSNILVPGFFDGVRPPNAAELEAVRRVPNDAAAVRADLQVDQFIGGDEMYHHHMSLTPTCNIAGLTSGYQGKGKKTVLPARASAKIDFRLVPDQHPGDIAEKVRSHLAACGFGDLEVAVLGETWPSRTAVDHPYVQLVMRAIRSRAGLDPILSPSTGGSGPDYIFTGVLGLPSVWLPQSPADSNNHAPNENIAVEGVFRAMKISASIMEEMGKAAAFQAATPAGRPVRG